MGVRFPNLEPLFQPETRGNPASVVTQGSGSESKHVIRSGDVAKIPMSKLDLEWLEFPHLS